jgi:hypothetical protein
MDTRLVIIHTYILQAPLLKLLLITLNAITNLELIPALEANTTFGILAHLLDVLLLALERIDRACDHD